MPHIPKQLTLHADRGTSMSPKPAAFLLVDLGVTKTHSRPHVSNDNPYSESQFRTLKYRPEFPDRFGCIQDSRAVCQGLFRWYNEEHRHSGLGLLTPAMVHYGQAENILRQRQEVLDVAYQLHPERFVRSVPKPPALASEVWINRPDLEPLTAAIDSEKCEMRLKKDKSGDTVGRPSWRSSLPGDPGAKFFCEKPQHMKNSLNFANTCLKVVDTRRVYIDRLSHGAPFS
jgi:Integrase core domain